MFTDPLVVYHLDLTVATNVNCPVASGGFRNRHSFRNSKLPFSVTVKLLRVAKRPTFLSQ